MQALGLLSQRLEILLLALQLLAQLANLAGIASHGEFLTVLGTAARRALEAAHLVLEPHDVTDHDVRLVKDQREKEREAGEIHVALAVKLARLDFEAFMAEHGGAEEDELVTGGCMRRGNRCHVRVVLGLCKRGELDLHAPHTVKTVHEQNPDKDKTYLHPILYLCNDWVLRDEAAVSMLAQRTKTMSIIICQKKKGSIRKESPLHGKRQRQDEQHEERHLGHEEAKYLGGGENVKSARGVA